MVRRSQSIDVTQKLLYTVTMDTAESLTAVLQIINTFGVTAVLYIFLRLFIKGEILPRAVYDEITGKLIGDISSRIISGVKEIIEDGCADDEQAAKRK